jgi:hypothetical protein
MADTDDWVEMRHPELDEASTAPDGGLFRCHPDAIEHWVDLGWEIVEPEPEPKPAKTRGRQPASASRGRQPASASSTTPEA